MILEHVRILKKGKKNDRFYWNNRFADSCFCLRCCRGSDMVRKERRMTKSENELAYSIKLAFVKAIIDLDNEDLWNIVLKALEEKKEEGFLKR